MRFILTVMPVCLGPVVCERSGLILRHRRSALLRREKHLGNQIGQYSPTLHLAKAENVDQSDSSIPFATAPEDTTAL